MFLEFTKVKENVAFLESLNFTASILDVYIIGNTALACTYANSKVAPFPELVGRLSQCLNMTRTKLSKLLQCMASTQITA